MTRHADAAARIDAPEAPIGVDHRMIRTRSTSAPTLVRRDLDRRTARPTLVAPPPPIETEVRPRGRFDRLKVILGAGDAVALVVGFFAVLQLVSPGAPSSWWAFAGQAGAITLAGLLIVRSQDLWVDRMIAVRMIELSRLARAAALLGLATVVLDRVFKQGFEAEQIFVAVVTSLAALVTWRSIYRTWLAGQRTAGHYERRVIIVGTDRRAVQLTSLFRTHPEAGVRVVGLVGAFGEARAAGLADLWMAPYDDADTVLASADVEGVVLCTSDIDPALLDVLIRGERGRERDLYLDPGLSGIDFRRVQALAIAHEPLLYVESPHLSQLQLGLKRAFDAVVAAALLIVFAPVLAVIALLVKLEDRGPVFFVQRRVGRDGVEFGMIKFRSMCIDAEERLAALQAANERTGPLFKLDGGDPRVTRIGRFLRATSLDELPQLWNVLRGDMSLVGPRPALASEVAEFPTELNARHQVRPGITGLWQVEARDNPSFEAYRRLDLFYVENWSLALDSMILFGTIDQVLLRPLVTRRRRAPSPAPEALACVTPHHAG